jgi:hypothetical protein
MRGIRGWARAVPGTSLALALALLTGCKTPGSYREPVALFQQGNAEASSALGQYYSELNRFERDLYLDERLYDTGLEVLATDASGGPTPLVGKLFSPESIQARMDAIAVLGVYAERLATLAGAQNAGKLPEGATALGTQLGALGQKMQTLAGKGDASASRYVEPVTTLVGVVASLVVEARQGQALQKAVEQGSAQVNAIIGLLEKDMVEVLGPQRLTGARQALASRVMFYNLHREKLSLAERRAVLDDIRRASDDYEALVVANPVELARALRDAHEALLSFSRAERKVESFEELSAAMQSFQGRVETAAAAVKRIHEPPKE